MFLGSRPASSNRIGIATWTCNTLLVEVQPLTARKSACGKFQHIGTRDSIFIMWVQFSPYGVPFSSHASTHTNRRFVGLRIT